MRIWIVFAAALVAGALTVSGQDNANADLQREIERLTELLEQRAKATVKAGAAMRITQKIYDISDLCAPVHDSVLKESNLIPSKYRPVEPPEVDQRSPYEVDAIIELLRFTAEPETWDSVEGADIQPKNTHLFVTTIPRVHRKIAAILDELRAYLAPQVAIDIVAVPVGPEAAALLLERPRELGAAEAKRLLETRPLGVVRVVCSDGQQVVQQGGRLRTYLQDYDVEIAQGASIGDPIRQVVFEGFAAEVRAMLDRGADGALLKLRLQRTALKDPIRRIDTEHGPLELPEMALTRVNTSIWVPLGRTVVVGGCTVGTEPCVFLATVRKVSAGK